MRGAVVGDEEAKGSLCQLARPPLSSRASPASPGRLRGSDAERALSSASIRAMLRQVIYCVYPTHRTSVARIIFSTKPTPSALPRSPPSSIPPGAALGDDSDLFGHSVRRPPSGRRELRRPPVSLARIKRTRIRQTWILRAAGRASRTSASPWQRRIRGRRQTVCRSGWTERAVLMELCWGLGMYQRPQVGGEDERRAPAPLARLLLRR